MKLRPKFIRSFAIHAVFTAQALDLPQSADFKGQVIPAFL
jgi:hypothetical protein